MKEETSIESRVETAKSLFDVLSQEITLEEAKEDRAKESGPDA